MVDILAEWPIYLLSVIAILISVYIIYRNEKFRKEQTQLHEDFLRQQKDQQHDFEIVLEKKLLRVVDIKKSIPEIILEINTNEENYKKISKSTEDSLITYSGLQLKFRSGELEFINILDSELYEKLKWINTEINDKMQRIRQMKRECVQGTQSLWVKELNRYKHWGFPIEPLVKRIFTYSFPSVMDGDLDSIRRNFDSELSATISTGENLVNPFDKDTPATLTAIAKAQFREYLIFNQEILADLKRISAVRDYMLKLMGEPITT